MCTVLDLRAKMVAAGSEDSRAGTGSKPSDLMIAHMDWAPWGISKCFLAKCKNQRIAWPGWGWLWERREKVEKTLHEGVICELNLES